MTSKGNQTGHDLPEGETVSYNPGYPEGGAAPDREPILRTDSKQDISQREKVTLGITSII